MKKVWINPAYKDLVQVPKTEEKKEVKPVNQLENKKQHEKAEPGIIVITESVINKLKKNEINTDKIIDFIGKEFTKASLKEELRARGVPAGDIDKIVCRAKEKKEQKPPPSKQGGKQTIEHKLFQYFIDKQIPIETRLINGETFTGRIKWFSEWLIGLEVDENTRTIIIPRLMMVYYTQLQENSLSDKEINKLPLLDVTTVEVNMLQQFKDNKTSLLFHMQGGMEIKGTLDWYEKLIYHIKNMDRKTEHTIHRGNILYFEEVV